MFLRFAKMLVERAPMQFPKNGISSGSMFLQDRSEVRHKTASPDPMVSKGFVVKEGNLWKLLFSK